MKRRMRIIPLVLAVVTVLCFSGCAKAGEPKLGEFGEDFQGIRGAIKLSADPISVFGTVDVSLVLSNVTASNIQISATQYMVLEYYYEGKELHQQTGDFFLQNTENQTANIIIPAGETQEFRLETFSPTAGRGLYHVGGVMTYHQFPLTSFRAR